MLNRQCASIVGSCGIGKTSFLWYASLPEVQATFPFDLSHLLFVFLDLAEFLHKTREDFFHSISMSIILQGTKLGLTLHSHEYAEDEFSSILDQVEKQGYFPVLLLDAFDIVTLNEHFDLAFFEFLHALASWGQVSYVTATTAPLPQIFHSGIAGSPFFNIFYTYHLEALLSEEAEMLITALFQQNSIACSEEEGALVLRLAGHHPLFIHHICSLLCEQKLKGEKIDERKLKYQAYDKLSPLFEKIWNKLSNEQQMQLQYGAQQERNQQCELSELRESCLFREFAHNICRSQVSHMRASELSPVLTKIGNRNLVALGENTKLRLMNSVAQSFKQDTLPSLSDIGKAIFEILKKALNSLQETGMQKNASAEWIHYTILYYSYFKEQHLKKEQIAERLGMNMQQYSSERRKAINSLLNKLCKLEDASTLDEC